MRYDDDNRPVMRVDVELVDDGRGGLLRGVTGVQFFGGADGFVDSATLRALGLDGQVDDYVRLGARVHTPAEVEGAGFQAEARAWDAATYERLPRDSESLRFSLGRIAPAGPAVAREDRRRTLDEEVATAADLYRQSLERSAKEGGRARPVDEVAEYLGLERRTAARRIDEARKRGLLPPTSRGKAQA
ncbi:hypothetical protein [Janibacter melonis]|uniref:hypothetical protein n=1 Tax=Janibacter melonis TaxID=262209 RepID=UPI00174BCC7C|nr:hypothetical protein [Janibacter melonis]